MAWPLAFSERPREGSAGALDRLDRWLALPGASDLAGALSAVGMLTVYLWRSPHIFDIQFGDESIYIEKGVMLPPHMMASYEGNGLYGLIYHFLHYFIPDTIALHLWGATILIASCGLAIYVSVRIISGSPLYGVVVTSAFVFSTAFLTWPRPTFPTIAIIAIGLSIAHFTRPRLVKALIATLTAFLACFIRPEFMTAFYAFLAASFVLALIEIRGAVRGGGPRSLLRVEFAPGWVALAAVVVLIELWSLPTFVDHGRAFGALCAHYALRYVTSHGLSINPWWNCTEIIDPLFHGARSAPAMIEAAPKLYFEFIAANALDFIKLLRQLADHWFNPHTWPVRGYAGLATILVACAIAVREIWHNRWTTRRVDLDSTTIMSDAATAALFLGPPLASCILVYPRMHYAISAIYLLFVGLACLLRWVEVDKTCRSGAMAFLMGAGFVLATPSLPRVDQPIARSVEQARTIPGVKLLFEAELGWCVYYRPPCQSIHPRVQRSKYSFAEHIKSTQPNAILLSVGLAAVDGVVDDPLYKQLKTDPQSLGFSPNSLPDGTTLLIKH